jgi:DNA-binding transcriptional LysR family regulator
MELRRLRYFVAVAEELHFSRAAERLHIGQPPLSQQIQLLEEELGVRLLERTRRWVRLTEAGRLFLEDARRILALSEQAAETARRADRGELGELRIGFTGLTPLTDAFNKTVNEYRKAFPRVALSFSEMSTLRQVDAIRERRIDLGFMRPSEAPLPREVVTTTLRRDPLMLVAPVHHPLLQRESVSIRDLADQPFVMFSADAGTGMLPMLQRLCRDAGFEPKVALQAREGATVIGLVAAGCGVAILPESVSAIHIKGVGYLSLSDPAARTQLMLARHRTDSSPLAEAFVEFALRVASAQSPSPERA